MFLFRRYVRLTPDTNGDDATAFQRLDDACFLYDV